VVKVVVRSFGWDKYIQFFEGAQRGLTHVLTKAELVSDAVAAMGGRHCVMVGDTESDLRAARQNGLDFVAVGYGYGCSEHLLKLGAYIVVANVRELSEHLAHLIGRITIAHS